MKAMEPLLTYDSVEICFGTVPAVRGVSFSLRPGEILGIVGESGSGKSTLLKAALGLLGKSGVVTAGDIWFRDMNLTDMTERELMRVRGAHVGVIFQDAGASFCPIRTIGSQIHECLASHAEISHEEAKAAALELFTRLNFKEGERVWNSYPFELSGGMNQRAAVAAAMLMKPEVLLADEPTSALDSAVQKQVVAELMKLREMYGTAIIIVTHDIGVVSAMADGVLVLKKGEAVEYGAARQVLNSPSSAYTRELLAAVPKLRRK